MLRTLALSSIVALSVASLATRAQAQYPRGNGYNRSFYQNYGRAPSGRYYAPPRQGSTSGRSNMRNYGQAPSGRYYAPPRQSSTSGRSNMGDYGRAPSRRPYAPPRSSSPTVSRQATRGPSPQARPNSAQPRRSYPSIAGGSTPNRRQRMIPGTTSIGYDDNAKKGLAGTPIGGTRGTSRTLPPLKPSEISVPGRPYPRGAVFSSRNPRTGRPIEQYAPSPPSPRPTSPTSPGHYLHSPFNMGRQGK